MNSSETKRTPVRLTGLQVTDASVFEDFNARLEAFEETLAHVQGITDAEELAGDVSALKARLADISAGIGIMQETDALIAGSVVDVSSYAHGLVIPAVPQNVGAFTNDAGYLTEHQDISGLATRQEVEDVSAYAHSLEIPSVQGLATDASLQEVAASIPAVPTTLSSFTNDAGYITEHQSLDGLATDASLQELAASIPENVQEYDDTSLAQAIEDVSSYARSIQIPEVPRTLSAFTNDVGFLTEHQSLDGLATDASLQEVASSIPEAYDDSSLAQAIDDVSTYARSLATDASLQEAVEHADSGDASVVDYIDTEIGGNLDQVLDGSLNDGFATISWVERTVQGMIPGSVSAFFNDAGYLTEHQSLEGLTTDASFAEAIDGVDASIAALDASLQEVAASIPQVPAYISNFINDTGYLTEHQSLEGLATDASLQEVASSIPEAYDDTSLKGYVDTQDASLKTYIDTEIGGRIDEVLDGSLAGFATRDYVDQQVAGIVIPEVENYDDTSLTQAVNDVSVYAHGLVIPTVPSNVSAFTNDAGYLDASTLDASFLDPVIEKFGDTDTVLDEILTGSVSQIDASLLDILGEDVQ